MNISEKSIIGELVAEDYRTASVFKQYGIDFCCNGNRSISEACERKDLNKQAIIGQLQQIASRKHTSSIDYNSWPIDLLADYIEKKHHRYVDSRIKEIRPYLNKIVKVHGTHHPELIEVEQLFIRSASDLTAHMKKEEMILFPFIRKMTGFEPNDTHSSPPPFGTIRNPIAMMHHEHDTEGERFREISRLTNNFSPPDDACNTYRVTFALLKEFEEDLHLHIHLENNILFPKAIKMEQELTCN